MDALLKEAIRLDESAKIALKHAPGVPGSIGLREAAELAKRASDAFTAYFHDAKADEIDADIRTMTLDLAYARRWLLLDDAAVTMASAYARSDLYTDVARAAELFFWAAQICEDAERQEELHEAAYRLAKRVGYEACKAGLDCPE